jgi:F0F1-type ATP synthase membrane subunit c/vacuolar-type H+-ATPase subunit K
VADNPAVPPTDPGWGGVKGLLLSLVPVIVQRKSGGDPLVVLRRVFLSFCTALVLIMVVVAVVVDTDEKRTADMSVAAGVAITAVTGIAALIATRFFADRPLECADAPVLANSYRTRFFMRMAFAETTALLGFVLSFVAQSPLPYVVALPFSSVGFWWAAPTARNLARDQAQLTTSECTCNLLAALRVVDG